MVDFPLQVTITLWLFHTKSRQNGWYSTVQVIHDKMVEITHNITTKWLIFHTKSRQHGNDIPH